MLAWYRGNQAVARCPKGNGYFNSVGVFSRKSKRKKTSTDFEMPGKRSARPDTVNAQLSLRKEGAPWGGRTVPVRLLCRVKAASDLTRQQTYSSMQDAQRVTI